MLIANIFDMFTIPALDKSVICRHSHIHYFVLFLFQPVRRVSVGISVGKILCQRDESDPLKRAKLFYSKLPLNIHKKKVLLVDPMVATGGSASLAIRELVKAGVKAENITFLNVVSCPTGLKKLEQDWPTVSGTAGNRSWLLSSVGLLILILIVFLCPFLRYKSLLQLLIQY